VVIVPPPPEPESAAGAQLEPSHFKTSPEEGIDVVVSTSERWVIVVAPETIST